MSAPAPRTSTEESTTKKLGLLHATLLVMGGILGVGIFFTPARVAELVPSEPAFLAMWGFGALVALCGAFTFAEYGASFPDAGGWFVYLRRVYPPVVSFLFAWVVLLVVSTGALASVARFGMAQLTDVAPFLGDEGSTANKVSATVLLLGVTGIALGGVKLGAGFQSLLMVVKLAAVVALVVAGVFFAAPATEAAAALAPAAVESRPLWKAMVLAALPVLYAVGGWQMLGYVAGEVRDPQRTIPRAVVLGVGGVMLAYVLLNLDYLHVLGLERMAGDFGFAGEVAQRSFGAAGGNLLSVAMAISAIGFTVVTIIASPYIYVAMSRERIFFERFGHLHPTTGAPVLALCTQAALAIGYVWAGTLSQLVDAVTFAEWIFHGLVAFGLIWLRWRRPECERPYRSPLFPLAPLVYGLIATGVVWGTLEQAEREATFPGLLVVTAGLLVYPVWTFAFRRARAEG